MRRISEKSAAMRPEITIPSSSQDAQTHSYTTRHSSNDSGYVSPGLTPRINKRSLLPGRNLKIFNKQVPDDLKARFLDIRILYTQSLWEAISSRRKRDTGDISMKLKYMGDEESSLQLYIVIQCERRVAKKVENFFAQEHVKEDLGHDFQVHVIDSAPLRLSEFDAVSVFGDLEDFNGTLCGMKIRMSTADGAFEIATLGGLILATTTETHLYGLTAGHPLARLCNDSSTNISYGEVDGSNLSDEISDYGSNESSGSSRLNDSKTDRDNHDIRTPFNPKIQIGKAGANSFRSTTDSYNHDWALVELDHLHWAPNCLKLVRQSSSSILDQGDTTEHSVNEQKDVSLLPLIASVAKTTSITPEQSVVAITGHGLQRGTLTSDCSSLMIFPGSRFVDTFNFIPGSTSELMPGDSGSWVANEMTGEVYGHLVSIDTLGEGYVMPIQSTLRDIRAHIGAEEVRFPSKEDVFHLRDSRKRTTNRSNPTTIAASTGANREKTYDLRKRVITDKDNDDFSTSRDTRGQMSRSRKRKAEDSDSGYSSKKSKTEATKTNHKLKRSDVSPATHSNSVAAPSKSTFETRRSSSWSLKDDELLIQARSQGYNWSQIAPRHFPNRSPNSCRKRHERLMERKNAEEWDGVKLNVLAQGYMEVRREMWSILADRVGEKWVLIEQKCMEKGLKNLTQAFRSAQKIQNDSGVGISDDDKDYDERLTGDINQQSEGSGQYLGRDCKARELELENEKTTKILGF